MLKKALYSICFFLFLFCIMGCNGPDPIDPKNTYSIENQTEENVKVLYTILAEHIYWENPRTNYTDSCMANSNAITTLPLDKYGFYISDMPSQLFESIIFISTKNDTLQILRPIDDTEWKMSESIADYGYKVKNCNWLYKFTKL